MSNKIEVLAKEIAGLTALELNQLKDSLAELFGISPDDLKVSVSSGGSNEAEAVQNTGPTTVKLVMTGADAAKKIALIKALKTHLGLESVGEAKTMIEAVLNDNKEQILLSGIDMAKANELKAALTAEGATIAIQ